MTKKILILVPLLLGLSFCSAKEDIAVDFVKEFPEAVAVRPFRDINLFHSWTAKDRMYGWNRNKKLEKNAILVPAPKECAVFRFGYLQKKDERIVLSFRSLLGEIPPVPPLLDIFLNGHKLYSSPLSGKEYRRISLRASEKQFRIGENYLEFRRSDLPSSKSSKHWLALRKFSLGSENKPAAMKDEKKNPIEVVSKKGFFGGKKGLVMPPNTAVSYFCKLEGPAKLSFDIALEAFTQDSPEGSQFFVYLETPEGSTQKLYGQTLKKGRGLKKGVMPIDLSPFQDEILQISFVFKDTDSAENSEKRLFIWNPRIFYEDESSAGEGQTEPSFSRPFNILIYLVDALRPDHLPFFGYEKNTAPHMTEFADDCVLFPNAYAQASWTRPSVGTLFTGLYPFQHQAITLKSGLAAEFQTLAEFLKEGGFHTIGISSNAGIKEFFNFHQGFDYFKYHSNLDGGLAEMLNTYAFEQLGQKRTPFFLYLHAMEPHRPYLLKPEFIPPPVKDQRIVTVGEGEKERYSIGLNQVLSDYDASITQCDKAFGDLMDELKRLGLYDSSLIILMSDHGEEFYEHGGFAHGQKLYQESIKHLFIVKLPIQKNAGTVIADNVQEIDIFPTLLDMAGLPVPAYCAGKSLKRMFFDPESVKVPFHREIFLETANDLQKKAVVDGHWKLIHNGNDWTDDIREYELYNLRDDPGETMNLYGRNSVAGRYLAKRLRGWSMAQEKLFALGKEDIEKTLTQKEIDELKALGYIK